MNKIININLGGRLIPIDEKAYDQLRIYIDRLKSFFLKEPGGDEILRDMEDRIGELLEDRLKRGQACIFEENIDEVISIMGSPEEIENETGEENTDQHSSYQHQTNQKDSKKLFRNANEKVLGGVCGGLGSYFNIDPAIIRIIFVFVSIFWGTGILIYLLLWIILPESEHLPSRLKRRLYRNPDNKVIGGVCSGIASYANIDPIIPRLLFVLPFLGMIFFSIIDNSFWVFSFSLGALPTSLILYFILWAAVPKATSVAEKLEMRGEKADFQNLSQAMKDLGKKVEEFPKKNKSSIEKFATIIAKIFVFFFLIIILIVISSIFIALIATLFGLATSSVLLAPLGNLLIIEQSNHAILWISLSLILIIPAFACIRGLIKISSGSKKKTASWFTITLTLLFIASIFGLFWIGSSVARDFKVKFTHTENLPIQILTHDTLIIKSLDLQEDYLIERWDDDWIFRYIDDSKIGIKNISLQITESPDSSFHLYAEKSAYGHHSSIAEKRALSLKIDYKQEGNILWIPEEFIISGQQVFRGQRIHLKLEIPKGAVFKTENLDSEYYTYRSFSFKRNRFSYTSKKDQKWENGKYYRMGERNTTEDLDD